MVVGVVVVGTGGTQTRRAGDAFGGVLPALVLLAPAEKLSPALDDPLSSSTLMQLARGGRGGVLPTSALPHALATETRADELGDRCGWPAKSASAPWSRWRTGDGSLAGHLGWHRPLRRSPASSLKASPSPTPERAFAPVIARSCRWTCSGASQSEASPPSTLKRALALTDEAGCAGRPPNAWSRPLSPELLSEALRGASPPPVRGSGCGSSMLTLTRVDCRTLALEALHGIGTSPRSWLRRISDSRGRRGRQRGDPRTRQAKGGPARTPRVDGEVEAAHLAAAASIASSAIASTSSSAEDAAFSSSTAGGGAAVAAAAAGAL